MKGWTVQSTNFTWHAPVPAKSYEDARRIARERGFDARIEFNGELVATWSACFGNHIYNRALAS
jgi:hypothetical protein